MADTPRIYIQKSHHTEYKNLTHGKDAPFDAMTDVFVAAAAIGYRDGIKSPTDGSTQHVGFWHSLKPGTDVPMLEAIAIADTGSIEVIADHQVVLNIAAEYANAGIRTFMNLDGAGLEDFLTEVGLDALRNARPDS